MKKSVETMGIILCSILIILFIGLIIVSMISSGAIEFYYLLELILILPIIILDFVCIIVALLKKKINKKEESQEVKDKKIKRLNIILTIFIVIAFVLQIGIFANILFSSNSVTNDKPIIYIYPEKEQEVIVRLGNKEKILHSYPKYQEEWKVIAKPNGNLIDIETGRNLYGLYWEGKVTETPKIKDGFVVKGEDTIKFLEEKLEILGLNEREANEFIIYWLPKLEANKYNYIRFQTMEEINEYMPLEIIPTPDTLIRIVMEFKGLNKEIKVQEQILKTPIREGFVVVEWGGIEL